jgi:hypothetical protein
LRCSHNAKLPTKNRPQVPVLHEMPCYEIVCPFEIKAGLLCLNGGITTVILRHVKTAISIPDSLFEEADRLARRRGWSRSELYANAVTAYVNSERFSGVREKLDAVYGDNEEDSAIDPLLAEAQARSLPRERW